MLSRHEMLNRLTAKALSDFFIAAGFTLKIEEHKNVKNKPPKELVNTYGKDLLTNYEIVYVAQIPR